MYACMYVCMYVYILSFLFNVSALIYMTNRVNPQDPLIINSKNIKSILESQRDCHIAVCMPIAINNQDKFANGYTCVYYKYEFLNRSKSSYIS